MKSLFSSFAVYVKMNLLFPPPSHLLTQKSEFKIGVRAMGPSVGFTSNTFVRVTRVSQGTDIMILLLSFNIS